MSCMVIVIMTIARSIRVCSNNSRGDKTCSDDDDDELSLAEVNRAAEEARKADQERREQAARDDGGEHVDDGLGSVAPVQRLARVELSPQRFERGPSAERWTRGRALARIRCGPRPLPCTPDNFSPPPPSTRQHPERRRLE